MEPGDPVLLAGAEIHGFRTAADLSVEKLLEVASTRWFRPNEVHAILSNHALLKIQPQPIDNPTSGRVLLFDRKMLRNFRKDGHDWKKKKDGKTIQEAHEKLKIGNEDRIHVYYARSDYDPNFYRRCYWLLDKSLERIVLVHYRQTSELALTFFGRAVSRHLPPDNVLQTSPALVQSTEVLSLKNRMHYGSPPTLVHSAAVSAHSEVLGPCSVSEDINSRESLFSPGSPGSLLKDNCTKLLDFELSLHEINTLEWEDLVGSEVQNDASIMRDGIVKEQVFLFPSNNATEGLSSQSPSNVTPGVDQSSDGYLHTEIDRDTTSLLFTAENLNNQEPEVSLDAMSYSGNRTVYTDDTFLRLDNFGSWNCTNDDSLGLLHDLKHQAPSLVNGWANPLITSMRDHVFNISEISPGWSYSTEETKVIVVGHFCESMKHLMSSNIYCVFGELCVEAEMVQLGVYRCKTLPQPPGLVDFFITMDGHTPISQVLSFNYRSVPDIYLNGQITSSEDDCNELKWEEYQVQKRLAYLLFATSNSGSILSGRVTQKSLNEAKRFSLLTSSFIEKDWMHLLKQDGSIILSSLSAREDFLQLVLRTKLQEWLLLKVAQGCESTGHDSQGQGVIHLCVILNYEWAVRLYSLSSLSLDFRDIHGWTALHWAAYCGREKMVATLLSAGANPSLVTNPTSKIRGGCTAADLASKQGYEGLTAYLAERGLAAHFNAMSLSGNISHETPTATTIANSVNKYPLKLSEQELCLKESLAAYRNAADAADRIQSAIRERALRLQTKAIQLYKPDAEASQIVSAMKIQHAYRTYNRRKMMKAAARIQSHFRTWKMRKDFVNMRKNAIKIQAAYCGHQVRKQYHKICWSVGVLEKAILRWRLKRKGLRGIQIETSEAMRLDTAPESSTGEEEFFRISREQAEERVRKSVVRVQAMFRSYRAQQEYRRMKMTYEQAKLELCALNGFQ